MATPMDVVEPLKVTVEVLEQDVEIPEAIEKKFGDSTGDLKVDKTGFTKVRIRNFSVIRDLPGRIELPEFPLLGYTWRFLCFPRGNNNEQMVSLYLDYTGPQKEPWWGLCCHFIITAHSESEELTIATSKDARHRFTVHESDWGFTSFVRKVQIFSEEVGKRFLIDDCITLSVAARFIHDEYGTLWNTFAHYDSKMMTGYVGLKNQGATCYMNSILQSLYFTNSFRKAVYQIPADDEKDKNVPYALQKVFYNLQHNKEPAGTTELTRSFGWEAVDAFMQHDVQEFNRVLCDNLETKMKGTSVEGTVAKLLEGKYKMYIKCINVDYESSRVETFYDIQLNVKGLKTLEDSFKNYIEVETMDGDNKYMAAGHGLQDAKKGVIFEKFPPVLHLQLKRFEYDMMRDANVKINDRHEFPLSIDLRPYMIDPDQQPPQVYHLHGVLVHSGDSHGGHYCAFIRTKPFGDWFKFDDDRVTRCSQKEAMDDNFGVDLTEPTALEGQRDARTYTRMPKKFTNAYMLVYIRETELNEVLCEVTDADIPQQIVSRIEREKEDLARHRKEKEQEQFYMDVTVITDEAIRDNHGPELVPKSLLVDIDPTTYRIAHIKKSTTLAEFKVYLSQEFKIPLNQFRLWSMIQRQNATVRPDALVKDDESLSMEQIRIDLKTKIPLFIYMEQSKETLEKIDNDSQLLFFKYFDPVAESLTFITPYILRTSERLLEVIEPLNKIMGFPPKTALRMFEEIRPDMLEEVKLKVTLSKAELSTGDIIIFQKETNDATKLPLRFPSPKTYYEFLNNRTVVKFRARETPKEPGFTLQLSLKMPYDEVAKVVGDYLKFDPQKIRFTSHKTMPEGPYAEIKRQPTTLLENMLNPYNYGTNIDILYYEKMEISIAEMENKISKPVVWINGHRREEATHTILVQKTDTAAVLLEALKPKITLREQNKKLKTSNLPAAVVEHAETVPESSPNVNGNASPNMVSVTRSTEEVTVNSEEDTAATATTTVSPPHVVEEEVGSGILRLYEVKDNKIFHIIDPKTLVKDIGYSCVAEEIPIDQLNLDPKDKLIQVAHFHQNLWNTHSPPFLLRIRHGELFSETKARLHKILAVSEKEFSKYRFAFIQKNSEKPEYIENDNEVLSSRAWTDKDFLGIDHPDRNARHGRYSALEKPLVIKN